MNSAFGSLAECVQDGVMSACGAYDSAPLSRIFQCLESRREQYFDESKSLSNSLATFLDCFQSLHRVLTIWIKISYAGYFVGCLSDGNIITLVESKEWKSAVRRTLFSSDRFGIEKSEHSSNLSFFVVNEKQDWYWYPSTLKKEVDLDLANERIKFSKKEILKEEAKFLSKEEHSAYSESSSSGAYGKGQERTECVDKSDMSTASSELRGDEVIGNANNLEASASDSSLDTNSTCNIEKSVDLEENATDVPEQSQLFSYKTELTLFTQYSNMELSGLPTSPQLE